VFTPIISIITVPYKCFLPLLPCIGLNLHKDENAYIAIFISHHSKNAYILDEIILNAQCLFDKYKSATLSKEELSFF